MKNYLLLFSVVSFSALLILSGTTSAVTYDNDPNMFWARADGSDSCTGQNNMSYAEDTVNCAWRTSAHALSMVTAGQTLVYSAAGGIFDETASGIITHNGNSTHRITITTDGSVVNIRASRFSGYGAFDMSERSYINLTGYFNITGFNTAIDTSATTANANDNIIKNIRITNTGSASIEASQSGTYVLSNILIDNVSVRQLIRDTGNQWDLSINGQAGDLDVIKNITITNSYFEGGTHNCIDVHDGIKTMLIENNTFYGCTSQYGVHLHNYNVYDVVIRNNIFDNSQRGLGANAGSHNILIENNVFRNIYDTQALLIFSVDGEHGYVSEWGDIRNITVKNNIFTNNDLDIEVWDNSNSAVIDGLLFENNSIEDSVTLVPTTDGDIRNLTLQNPLTEYITRYTGYNYDSSNIRVLFTDNKVFSVSPTASVHYYPNNSSALYSVASQYPITITKYPMKARPSSGYATITTDGVNLTSIQTDITAMPSPKVWSITIFSNNSATIATFNISTGKSNTNFQVYRNGTLYATVTTNSTGGLNYKYSDGFSTYEFSFQETSGVITVLNIPQDTYITNNQSITFNCSASSLNPLVNVTLYGNWSGWHANETKIVTGTSNSTIFAKTLSNGTYKWNCLAYDSSGNFSFAQANYTFKIDMSATTTSTTTTTTTSTTSTSSTTTTLPTNATTIAIWHLDEGTGTKAFDSSGNNNSGTIYGANWTTGKIGNALQFDGMYDYVNAGSNSSLTMGMSEWTIETWIKTSLTAANNGVLSTWSGAGGAQRYVLYFPSGYLGKIQFQLLGAEGNAYVISTSNVNNGQWHHIAGVRNSTHIKIYVDGNEESSTLFSSSISVGNSGSLIFGGQATNDYNFNGTIDEVKIYNGALSAAEILAEYLTGNPTTSSTTTSTTTTTLIGTTTTTITTTIISTITTLTSSTTTTLSTSTTSTSTTAVSSTTTTSTTLPLCTVKGDQPPCDGLVDDWELLDYINKWAKGLVPDFDLLEAIKNWASV